MLKDEIKSLSKTQKVLVLFDMDGTLVEYGINEKQDILDNKPDFYFEKRPMKTTVKIAKKLTRLKNVTVGILSNCYYPEQKADKLKWLKEFMPFIDFDYAYFNVYSQLKYEKSEKDYLKVNIIKSITGFDKILLIEDNHEIIKATNKIIPNTAHHVSRLIK